jgi:polyphosphate kinase
MMHHWAQAARYLALTTRDPPRQNQAAAGKRKTPMPTRAADAKKKHEPKKTDQPEKLSGKDYEREIVKLQAELVKLQFWIKETKARIVVLFEGRDAAGKGGMIKAITECVSPRVFRTVALPAPNERERTQVYFQRYVEHLPAGGEIVIFDRSWYNRAGVEHVMGFCTDQQYQDFLQGAPLMESWLIDSGLILVKYWLEVEMEAQTKRFEGRINDPRKIWKLSPMDLESHRLWDKYTLARDAMFRATDTEKSPWYVVNSNDKRRGRLNCIQHMLHTIPYKEVPLPRFKLPKRKQVKNLPESSHPLRYIPTVF